MLDNKKYNKLKEKGIFKGKGFMLDNKYIEYIFNESYKIKQMIPKGRITYEFLEPKVKEEVDNLVHYIIKNNNDIKKLTADYVELKLEIAGFYSDKNLDKQEQKYIKEIEKIISNKILGIVKSINRLENEFKTKEIIENRQKRLIKQTIFDLISLLYVEREFEKEKYNSIMNEIVSELSKEAKKEIYLKNQDKGYER